MRPTKHTLAWITTAYLLAVCLLAAAPAPILAQQPPPAAGDEAQLIAVVESERPLFDRAKACQRLAVVGTKDAVPALAKLLADNRLSHYARYALEPIADPAADDALRGAVGQLEGDLLIGVINSIGVRRDAKAVDVLEKLLGGADARVAAAAAGALGRIASPEAVRTLRHALAGPGPLPTAVADACLIAATVISAEGEGTAAMALTDAVWQADVPDYLHAAALLGAIRARGPEGLALLVEQLCADDNHRFRVALRMAHELPGGEVTRVLVSQLRELPAQRQALVVSALGNRADKAALPAVLEVAQDGPVEVRIPAVRGLAMLGDVSAVPVLLAAAVDTDRDLAQAARDSLATLPGQPVDAELASLLETGEVQQRLVLIDLVGRRGIGSTVPTLWKLADDDDREVRAAAIASLGLTVKLDELPALIQRLVTPPIPADATAAQKALVHACLRMPDRDACAAKLLEPMAQAPTAARQGLLALLGVVGGPRALQGVAAAASHTDEDVRDAATRVLGEWLSVDAAPVLLELAKTLGNDRLKIRALRGYIRIARQFDLSDAQKLDMYRTAMQVASRDVERQLVLAAIGRVRSSDALDEVVRYLAEPGLKNEAGNAAVSIADKIVQSDPAAVVKAMEKVLRAAPGAEVARQARALLRRAR